jgi:hypothetical protein
VKNNSGVLKEVAATPQYSNYISIIEEERDRLIFDLVKGRLDSEVQRTEGLDSKATNVLVSISIVISLLLAAAIFQLSIIRCASVIASIYFVGIAILIAALGLSLLSFKVRRWLIVPDVNALIENYSSAPTEEILKRTTGTMKNAVIDMEMKNDQKAKLIDLSWYYVIAGLIFISVFILMINVLGASICFNAM